MATKTITEHYTIGKSASKKLISSPRIKIKQTDVFNDIKLNKSEKIAHAAKILSARRCK